MPLTPQEQRCIDLTLPLLGSQFGGVWRVDHSLDDLYNSESSPECLVTCETIDAAIEVKRLTGSEITRSYHDALRSLPRALDPGCPGYFVLIPQPALGLPVDRATVKVLRREINRVARELLPGQTGAIRLERTAWVALESEDGPGRGHCCHNYGEHTPAMFDEVLEAMPGSFMLVDSHLPDHSFVTPQAIAHFRAEFAAACARRVAPNAPLGSNHFAWYEEIGLLRCNSDEDSESGLEVLAVSEAENVAESVSNALAYVLEKALAKFRREPRWATKHVIVLDREEHWCTIDRVKKAASSFDDDELRDIDLIALVDASTIDVVWSRGHTSPTSV